MSGYTNTFEIAAPAASVYEAITKGVTAWWTTGSSDASTLGDVFTTRFDKTYNHIKVSALDQDRHVEWQIMEHFHDNETLTRDDEWTGTRIIWTLNPIDNGNTSITFLHDGLVQSMECWDICEAGWNFFLLDSLKPYLEEGEGQPFQHNAPST